ncbi:hypothetical protein MHYP_G00225110 [Metynnis hypsauchen]
MIPSFPSRQRPSLALCPMPADLAGNAVVLPESEKYQDRHPGTVAAVEPLAQSLRSFLGPSSLAASKRLADWQCLKQQCPW